MVRTHRSRMTPLVGAEYPISSVVVIRALVKDVAQMLPGEKLGAEPREATHEADRR